MTQKILLACLFVIMGHNALAATQATFSANKVSVIVQGPAGDMDAQNLYNSILAKPTDDGKVVKKTTSYTSINKEKVFDLVCSMAKNTNANASCTFDLYFSSLAAVDLDSHIVEVFVAGADAQGLANLFVHAGEYDNIVTTSDNRMGLTEHYATDTNELDSFEIFYQQQ